MENEGEIECQSEKSESPSEKSFTIIWKIENSIYFHQAGYKLQSPAICIDAMEQTKWRLVLHRMQPTEWIYATVKREAEDHGPEQFDLHYGINIVTEEEGKLKTKPCSHAFRKDESGPHILLFKDDDDSCEPFLPRKKIICVMKKNNGPISLSGQCLARTRIKAECFEFNRTVKNFGALTPGTKRTLKVLASSSTNEVLMTVDLRIESGYFDECVIDIIPAVAKSEYRYLFSCDILDFSGNESDLQYTCEHSLQKTETLTLNGKAYLEKYADYYLKNDSLRLSCEVTVLTGIQSEEIVYERVEEQKVSSSLDLVTSVTAGASPFSLDCDANLCAPSQKSSAVDTKRNDNPNNPFPNVIEDIAAFYGKGLLCDAKLQTATETFPVHKVILSVRSPVFEAIFTTNMKEEIEECVRIDEVEAETIKRMLLFLYSDSLEELEWNDAKKLYYAADKYQVLSLKHRCSVILIKSINLSNCCELLVLADMHQDKGLKAAVQNFVATCEKEIFLSAQWRDMEKSHPHLAIDIFRALYMKSS